MRLSLGLIVALSLALNACGSDTKNSISDDPSATQAAGGASGLTKGPYHSPKGWQKDFELFVQTDAPDQVVEATLDAMKSWNDVIGHELVRFGGRADEARGDDLYGSLADNRTVIFYESRWHDTTSKPDTTLATTIWENDTATGLAITKGDIILNAEVYNFTDATLDVDDDVDTTNIVDTETVLLHEMGHLLGLEHVDPEQDPDSVMHAYTRIGPHVYRRTLSLGDAEKIQGLYP